MNRWRGDSSDRKFSGRLYRAPVIWIVVLLGGWLAIAEWPALASSVLSLAH